jgi:hypothetical protein
MLAIPATDFVPVVIGVTVPVVATAMISFAVIIITFVFCVAIPMSLGNRRG